ncbi:hypothetical protein LR48_Vigan01g291900 [Vigna angularis]|uniref:Uncharacterized protein n=1 Tax=Phaseolus angularis TaxID=3914 RepID=A0A0L9TS06_PHAAN|nr:hypothetical protein LR48_Vigan01g291900 [Vigna angularis]
MNCEMWFFLVTCKVEKIWRDTLHNYSCAPNFEKISNSSESSIGLSKFKSSKWKCVSVLLEERKLRCFSAGAGRREKAMRSSSFRGSRPIWFVVGRVWGGEVGNAHVMEVLRFGSSLAESGVEKLAACDVWRREARCAWSDDADVIGEGCTAAGFTRQAVHQGGGWAHMRMLRRTQMWCYWVKYDTTNDLFVMVFDAGVGPELLVTVKKVVCACFCPPSGTTPRVSVDLNQNIKYIPEQPDWTTYRDPTPASPPPSRLQKEGTVSLATMVRPEMQGQRVRTVGSLNINDRLLHYVIVHMLSPRPANFARVLYEDIFMIWLLKNNIPINWPHHIMQHMLKCKASDAPLPYGVLITQIMQYCGVHVDDDVSTHIGTRHHFSINSLKRLNIVKVNGVWQHDVGDDEEEEQPQHDANPVQPPPDQSNPNMITQIWEGVQDLQHRMQGMEQMQGRVQRIEDNLANLSLDMNRQFAQLNQNVNLILHHLDD